ncbi:MAG: hypothetical protein U0270_06920 [Labilithrix sp.]
MSQLSSRIARALAASFVVVAVVAACGSEGGSSFDENANKDGGTSGTTNGGPNNGSSGSFGGNDGGTSGTDPDGGSSGEIDPNCKALTCADQKIGCGLAGDGCGRQIDCGGCGEGERCGGPGAPSQCVSIQVAGNCTPKDCASQGITCGQAGDGCGKLLECGTCAADEQCGAVGRPSQCVKIVASLPDGGACVPLTKADFLADNKDCGQQSNGCGGTIDLGTCTAPEFCGGGGPSKCAVSGGGTCTKKTCADYPADVCGKQPDGCGGVTAVDCGTACVAPQVCGGGGVPSHCGGGTLTDDAGNACVPKKCLPSQCGQISDGCGNVVDCGSTACTNGEFCGGGGTPNQCGKPACTPLTQAVACAGGKNCGVVGDNCGGTITCGPATCGAGQVCGANGQPNVCGAGGVTADGGPGGGPCIAKKATDVGACPANACGPFADGCGGSYNCGTAPTFCPAGQTCGAGGPSLCGAPVCTKIPQATACAGKNCGQVADGCGGTWPCGVGTNACPDVPVAGGTRRGDICGGAIPPATGTPNVCGGGSTCIAGSLCNQQPVTCPAPGGGTQPNITALEGVVYMPNGFLPVNDAIVYVPDATLPAVPTGQNGTCTACAATATTPLVLTRTNTKGYFKLDRMPVGAAIPVVIQSGRWRKKITIDNTAQSCATKTLNTVPTAACPGGVCQAPTANNTTFGATQTADNNIPKFAVASGGADALQCLLRKIGIADSEFTNPAGTGRVNIYHGDQGTTKYSTINGGAAFPDETVLYGSTSSTDLTQLNKYDAVVLSCNGGGGERQNALASKRCQGGNNGGTNCTANNQCNSNNCAYDYLPATGLSGYRDEIKAYADEGGKLFLTHWHYAWLKYGPGNWGTTDPVTGTPTGKIATITSVDEDLVSPIGATINNPNTVGGHGYNLSDFLVQANINAGNIPPPTRGTLQIIDGQHNVFSIDAVRATPHISIAAGMSIETPVCVGGTRDGNSCCPANNGGNQGVCNGSNVCVGGSRNGQTCCSGGACRTTNANPSMQQFDFQTPLPDVAQAPGTQCGRVVMSDIHVARDPVGDTNGGFPSNCTSTGMTDQERTLAFEIFNLTSCGTPPTSTNPQCTPRTCAHPANVGKCGRQPDGCGGLTATDCNPCTFPDTCGGGGTVDVCGHTDCTKKTCPAGTCSDTGGVPDGCGGLAPCQPCNTAAGETCGGGGQANKCGIPTCTKKTCADYLPAFQCGQTGDGCGGTLTCACPAGQTCGAGNPGQPNKCGTCTPITQCPAGLNCGRWPDGCGGSISCGTCPDGTSCGAGGQANVCGVGTCVAKNCAQLGAECGQVSDGCGGITTCNNCVGDSFCNAQNICVPPTCQAKTCAQQGIECGPAGDTCGGFIPDCGTCAPGTACGAGGVPGKCGTIACTPLTCNQAQAECGQVANGCGGLTPNCGSCPGTKSCVNGACVNACTPRTCAEAAAECGFIGDGCGGALDCGSCSAGKVCGFNNQANKCGAEGPR